MLELPEHRTVNVEGECRPGDVWLVDCSAVRFAEEEDPCTFFEGEDMGHIAREIVDPNASAGRAQHAIAGLDPEMDLWGNLMRWYPPGTYRASVFLRSPADTQEPVVVLRVLQPWNHSVRPIASRPVESAEIRSDDTYLSATVDFALEQETAIDIRAQFEGVSDVYADCVAVERVR